MYLKSLAFLNHVALVRIRLIVAVATVTFGIVACDNRQQPVMSDGSDTSARPEPDSTPYSLGKPVHIDTGEGQVASQDGFDKNRPDQSVSVDSSLINEPFSFRPSGIVGVTPILSWVNSRSSGIADVLPDDRWSLPHQWFDGDSAENVWLNGAKSGRPLRDNPIGLRSIRPSNNYWVEGNKRSGESKWGYRDELILNRGTSQSRSLGFVAPWFDEWRSVGYAKQSTLAKDMIAVGGDIDYLVIDWEDYNTLYNINKDLEVLGVSLADYRTAVIQDPRWPSLKIALNQSAIAAGYDGNVVNFNDDLADMITDWNSGHSPKGWVWSRYMHNQLLASLEHVLFDSWAEQYPDLKASDYQKYISGPWPDYTHTTWSVDQPTVPLDFGSGTKWIVGTHQAPEGYGSRGLDRPKPIQIHLTASNNPPALPTIKWNPPVGMDEKFAVLIKTLRKLRGAVVGQDQQGNPPLMMWVAGDQYASSIWVPAGGAQDYQWYAEALFHYGLHDVKVWLAWNTYRMTDGSSEQRISDIVNEIDALIGGFPNREVLTKETINWDVARFILSGMDIGQARVYRFTPGTDGTVTNENPFTFRFSSDGSVVVPVPGGILYKPEATMSQLGWWVVEPAG